MRTLSIVRGDRRNNYNEAAMKDINLTTYEEL
jgi:hypothetical protein